MTTIRVSSKKWKEIRSMFHEGEKDELERANIGATICPPGGIVDADMLSPALATKLRIALGDTSTPSR